MYRVMIIDDEESARKLMRAAIDYKSLDMEVVGEAASGIEAINTIDEIKPDIAFVDISMPFMDGIEFTETATKRYPNLIIIIMTAIDKFEYARKCVSLPVFDYMLKPMVRAEVTKVLERAKEKLDAMGGASTSDFADSEEEPAITEANSTELIKQYVKDHITDSTLNLAFVAQNFGFSSSYLSRKFKQDTGKNFAKYLTDLRMKKAIKYAEQGYKMYQTAAEVGIPDPNYFGRCFKKYVGMSYSDYIVEKAQ
ncbi:MULTISPECIES: response regulator [unclassified Butyrivibrio]|uniref:response regulator transcription factor n=1 Tax=unclassified Butyrivibrio TaxID=2639466 RepID=UPI0008921DE1|nr:MULTISPECIES: response regulator [unclassified Butyrivibrio]SDB19675.1 Helix-turn-helix domain-containing protein [Butyrivibrio sp. INlla16]SEL60267.1 Helix-turn-helix domain-containing protein [Butyrivibrio sp. ob235]